MRRTSALISATFYLLLSTGAFACMVHCTSVLLFSGRAAKVTQKTAGDCMDEGQPSHQVKEALAHAKHGSHQHKKDGCGSGKDCNCCKKHGMYVVRENVRSAAGSDFSQVLAILTLIIPQHIKLNNFAVNLPDHPSATGPPVTPSIPIYLKVRSLLI